MANLYIFIVIFIVVIVSNYLKGNLSFSTQPDALLNRVLTVQQFTEIKTFFSSSTLHMVSANLHGENYVFATKKGDPHFSLTDLHTIYDLSKKSHIHNVVLFTSLKIPANSELSRKIRDYNFEVWDNAKIMSLLTSPSETYTKSVLRTSDTSYDTCKIDNSTVDPIQPGKLKSHSLLGNLFNKPNRL